MQKRTFHIKEALLVEREGRVTCFSYVENNAYLEGAAAHVLVGGGDLYKSQSKLCLIHDSTPQIHKPGSRPHKIYLSNKI